MFLEKLNRYFRRYEIALGARKRTAPVLPLVAEAENYSVLDAIKDKLGKDKASVKQHNGDIVELVKVKHIPEKAIVVLLFHRASPDAADPSYRKKEDGKLTVRIADKDFDEEQSVSAHLIIRSIPCKDNYHAVLEEIPGLSMATVREVIGTILHDYPYQFEKKGTKEDTTYCTVKAEGIKSETVADALRTGRASWITLTRPAPPEYIDGDGLWIPTSNVMKLRVKGIITEGNWRDKIGNLLSIAKNDGWEKFNVEISLSDQRTRQVSLDRDQDAKEILFVKADRVEDLVDKGIAVLEIIESKC